MLKHRFFLTWTTVALFTGCTSSQPMTNLTSQNAQPKPLTSATSLNQWVIRGAIAAKSPKKAWSASVNWQQISPQAYKIRLFGPLGGGAVMIENQQGLVTYRDGPKVVSSKNPDLLLSRETGIKLPVQNLHYWVRGLPAPGKGVQQTYNSKGQLTQIQQAGYTVNYVNFMQVGSLSLPRRIEMHGHDIQVKFIIKQWQIH